MVRRHHGRQGLPARPAPHDPAVSGAPGLVGPPDVVLGTAVADDVAGYQAFTRRAAELGYGRVWLTETYKLDPVTFAGWAATALPGHPLGLGVVPAPLRSGPQLAMIASTLAGLGVEDLEVLVGASSAAMTRGWHGRGVATMAAMEALVASARAAASGERTPGGFTNGLGPAPLRLGLAAFGPKMLRLAGRVADRVVLNMVAPAVVPSFLAEIAEGASAAGRPAPPVTVWAHVALDPSEQTVAAARRFVSGYIRVPGYDRAFAAQGFGAVVEAARAAASTREVRGLVPDELLVEVLGLGDLSTLRARLDAYREAGAHPALVPSVVADPGAVRTLAALAPEAGEGRGAAAS
ncbi:MAG: LLM class flavin-dependent oxidoreductase [Acidimicrobiia bacterium]|nr:LLM class flavin-dependent oxidoreductase [Acidimicrobiia bacterium]